MNKLRNMLVAMIAIFALSTSAFAGTIGLGLTGNVAAISGSGTGTEGTAADTSFQSAEVSDTTGIVSLFAEYTFDRFNGFTLGIDMIPGAANVSKGLTRTDTNNAHLEETGSATSTVRKANAEVENHLTYYAELPIHGGLYFKAGMVTMDVNTLDTGGNSRYGNTNVDGTLIGAGYKNEIGASTYYKVEGTTTEFDTISLASGTTNTIKADLDVTKLTFALGYKF